MREKRTRPALRYGLPCAIIIAALGSANTVIQARRHAIGPSARGLVMFSYLFFLISLLLLLAVGFRSARTTGRVRTGAWAGAVAVGLPFALLVLVIFTQTPPPLSQDQDRGTQIVGIVIALLTFVAAAAIVGAIVSLPAALVGRARYRHEHAEEIVARAAERAARASARSNARKAARARRPLRKVVAEWVLVFLAATAFILIGVVPVFAARWAGAIVTWWQALALAIVAVAAGITLVEMANRRRSLGYMLDWLGLMCLCFAIVLPFAERIGDAAFLITGAFALVYVWRADKRFMPSTNRTPPAELPERPPVFFRHDGETITVYPSRRKLAAHAAFAGGVVVVASALTFLFRAAGPTPVVAFGGFAVMGLIGFVPDFVRLVHHWPALIVNSDGITDLGSVGIIGFGLIPWHEIIGVVNMGTLRGGRFPELAIIPVSFHRLLARQTLLKRPFLRLGSAMGGGAIYISSIFLSQPPSEISQRTYTYVKSHAPTSYFNSDEQEDDVESTAREAQ